MLKFLKVKLLITFVRFKLYSFFLNLLKRIFCMKNIYLDSKSYIIFFKIDSLVLPE